MDTYLQILKKAKEQKIDFGNKKILVPIDENKFYINGELCFGRIFDNGVVCALHEVDCPCSETGYIKEPFFHIIADQYKTWISHGSMLTNTEFYTIY